MSTCRIEYVRNRDGTQGKTLSAYTGCLHGLDICATSPTCWARIGSGRFPKTCGGDFKSRFHQDRLFAFLNHRYRKPQMVAVSFMGDLFGDWETAEWWDEAGDTGEVKPMADVRKHILAVVRERPQDTFLFLTKRPENLAQYNPWPDNAWVGVSAWDDGSALHAANIMIEDVDAKVKWLSLEPLLGHVDASTWIFKAFSWLVIGAQTGQGAVKPEYDWWEELEYEAGERSIPVWLKNNLLAQFPELPRRQELPA